MHFSPEEINEFKTEAFELLSKAEASLLAIDQGASLKTHYDVVLRTFHNIKGAASIIDDQVLQSNMHQLESLFIQYEHKDTIPKSFIDAFLKGIDSTRSALNGKPVPLILPEIKPGEEASGDSPSESSSVSEASLNEFIAECREISQRLSLSFDQMEKSGFSPTLIDSVYRDIHSIKGSAQLFGFKDLGDLAHSLETVLEPVRRKQLPIAAPIMDILYRCIDLIEKMVDAIQSKSKTNFAKEVFELVSLLKDGNSEPPEKRMEALDSSQASASMEATNGRESTSTVRVPVALLDRLMTLVGEMVLVRNQVLQLANTHNDLVFLNLSQKLNSVTTEIQEELMKTRMQPVGNVLNKFHRIVRDLSKELKKQITLTLIGTETELDKTLLEAIKDPLTHIVRNSCDHGIESLKDRMKAGKTGGGAISVRAYHEGGQVIIDVKDDGKGLDREKIVSKAIEKGIISADRVSSLSDREINNFIFSPGFSTATEVSSVSGRGVGMDVVRSNIERVGGSVELETEKGKGTNIRLKLPLTLAIIPALIVRSHQERYAIPQIKLVELVRVEEGSAHKLEHLQGKLVLRFREKILPLIDLQETFGISRDSSSPHSAGTNIIVLNADGQLFGLIVEEVLDTADIVVKPLSRCLKSIAMYSGATILGDGSVAVILDIVGMAQQLFQNESKKDNKSLTSQTIQEGRLKGKDDQDYILFRLNAKTKHAISLGYVSRLEEFRKGVIEYSGKQRVVRYRDSVLPILSVNDSLNYTADSNHQDTDETIKVIVVKKGKTLFGLEVNEILDIFSTPHSVDHSLSNSQGIIGNLVTQQEVIVVVDPEYVWSCLEMVPASTSQKSRYENTADSSRQQPPQDFFFKRRNKFRILLAEDTVFIRKHVTSILQHAGYQVIAVGNGEEAIEALKGLEPSSLQLVISDIEMPKMNGFELAAFIKQDPKWKGLPLVALTSKTNADFVARGIQAGFTLYLEKIDSNDLIRFIDQLTIEVESKNPKVENEHP